MAFVVVAHDVETLMFSLGSILTGQHDRLRASAPTRRRVDRRSDAVCQLELRERRYKALRVIQRAKVVGRCMARDRMGWTPGPSQMVRVRVAATRGH